MAKLARISQVFGIFSSEDAISGPYIIQENGAGERSTRSKNVKIPRVPPVNRPRSNITLRFTLTFEGFARVGCLCFSEIFIGPLYGPGKNIIDLT